MNVKCDVCGKWFTDLTDIDGIAPLCSSCEEQGEITGALAQEHEFDNEDDDLGQLWWERWESSL
jgi:hypothetical protein